MFHGLWCASADEPAPAFRLLDLISFEFCRQDAGKIADIFCYEKIVLHEALDAELSGPVAVAHAGCDFWLQVEAQTLFGPSREVVEVAAHRPEEARGADKDAVFVLGEGA